MRGDASTGLKLHNLRDSGFLENSRQEFWLSIEATPQHRPSDAIDADHERGQAHVDVVLAAHVEHLMKSFDENISELVVDFRLAPEKILQVLHPLEVRHHDAARVG